ncbi:MAG: 2-iminoacetate synthase, partial [Actinomycetota bacterium]|nr:2-iminoacetate synthase [Actinomycetota bacterium]
MTTTPVVLESRPEGAPAGTAAADLLATDLAALRDAIDTARDLDVSRALATEHRRTLRDFAALLSPAASERLEELAVAAHRTTVRRFGRTIHLFAPLYLSNECVSTCTYCGFSAGNEIARRTLTPPELLDEARALTARGFRHLLL